MSKKKNETNNLEDTEIQYENEYVEEDGLQNKLKSLREELKAAKLQSQEYLTGWQKERASFANYKATEEKKRTERVSALKTTLISDFFPVLDSFDMAFGNKEAWESVDQNWRTGIEYIHTQLMNTLEHYGVSAVGTVGVLFDPMIHEPVSIVTVDDETQDEHIQSVIQRGYQTSDTVLRPAKVTVGKYEN